MKKTAHLNSWKFDPKVPVPKRIAKVRIHLKYMDLKKIIQLTPEERVLAIDQYLKNNFQKLLKTGLFEEYKLIGSKKRPRGIETSIHISKIEQLAQYAFIGNLFIDSIKGGKKIEPKTPARFFCIKMTVAIQIEGFKNGRQSYEERFVLIKARTHDEAYKKIEKQDKDYVKPYLNSDGRLVRWHIESLDDCYTTDIVTWEDLNDPQGAEVFSILKSRNITKERYWDGK